LASFAHLDNQGDSEKKAKRHPKALGEKRSNPGSFWFAVCFCFLAISDKGAPGCGVVFFFSLFNTGLI
jgi:hypothetical protein